MSFLASLYAHNYGLQQRISFCLEASLSQASDMRQRNKEVAVRVCLRFAYGSIKECI